MWWLGFIFLGLCLIVYVFYEKQYIKIDKIIINDIEPCLDYQLPKSKRARYVAVKEGVDSDVQYIKPRKGVRFFETYDVCGKNDLLNSQLVCVVISKYDSAIQCYSGESIVVKRGKRYYMATLKQDLVLCKDDRYMFNRHGVRQQDRIQTDILKAKVLYCQIVGSIEKTFDCYKPTNKKKGID